MKITGFRVAVDIADLSVDLHVEMDPDEKLVEALMAISPHVIEADEAMRAVRDVQAVAAERAGRPWSVLEEDVPPTAIQRRVAMASEEFRRANAAKTAEHQRRAEALTQVSLDSFGFMGKGKP